MSPPDLPPPTLVQDARGLERLLDDLSGQEEIAVDTEADSFYSYKEKVCLMQVTAEDRDYLVDPLSGIDVARLGPIFADTQKTKVFHDGEYDVLMLKRDYDFDFAGLFDTRVAAAALGMQAPGLAAVLLDRFGVELDKSMQRSNWAKRPLSDKQIRYARLDTHFLLPLMDELSAELETRERTMIVEGECRRLEALTPTRNTSGVDEFARIKGVRALAPLEQQCMRELFGIRERFAEEWDKPPFRVLNNHLLIAIARAQPRSMHELVSIDGIRERTIRRLGEPILAGISRAIDKGPLKRLPALPRKDGTEGLGELEGELFDRLKKWRKAIAESESVEASYLLNRHVMTRIASTRPKSAAALAEIEGVLDWQLEMFGDALVQLVREFEQAVKHGDLPKRRPWRR